jgi:hypothetical protein
MACGGRAATDHLMLLLLLLLLLSRQQWCLVNARKKQRKRGATEGLLKPAGQLTWNLASASAATVAAAAAFPGST